MSVIQSAIIKKGGSDDARARRTAKGDTIAVIATIEGNDA
jgi:hypothetical protein